MLNTSFFHYFFLITYYISFVTSGVPNLNKFIRGPAFNSAWTSLKKSGPGTFPIDHVCIDINNLLHQSLRDDEVPLGKAFSKLQRKLDQILKKLQPRRSVIFAVDGTAPYAKLITQRARRQADPTACRLTPGTLFMETCEQNLLSYIAERLEQHDGVSFFMSKSDSPTEGEVKIIEWIRNIMPLCSANNSVENLAIVGSDTDLVLQALCISQDLPAIPQVYVIDDSSSFPALLIMNGSKALSLLQSTLHAEASSLDPVILFLMIGNDYLPRFRIRSVEILFYKVYNEFVKALCHQQHSTATTTSKQFEPLYDNAKNTFNWKSLYLFMSYAIEYADADITIANSFSSSGEISWINAYQQRKENNIEVFEWEEIDLEGNRFAAKLTMKNQVFQAEGEFSSRKDAKKATAAMALRYFIPARYEELLIEQQIMNQKIAEVERLLAMNKLEAVIEYFFPSDASDAMGVPCEEAIPDDLRTSIEIVAGLPLYNLRKVRDSDVETYLYGLLWNMDMYKRGECSDFGYCYHQRPTIGPKEVMAYIKKKMEEVLERPVQDTNELLQELKNESIVSYLNAAIMKVGQRKYTSSLKSEISVLCLTPPAVASKLIPKPMKPLWRKIQEEAFTGDKKREKLLGYVELIDFIGTEMTQTKDKVSSRSHHTNNKPPVNNFRFSHKKHKQLKQQQSKQKEPVVQVPLVQQAPPSSSSRQSRQSQQQVDLTPKAVSATSLTSGSSISSHSSGSSSPTALHALSETSSTIVAASSGDPTSDNILSQVLCRTIAEWTVVAKQPQLSNYRGNFVPKSIMWNPAIYCKIPTGLHTGYSSYSTVRTLDD